MPSVVIISHVDAVYDPKRLEWHHVSSAGPSGLAVGLTAVGYDVTVAANGAQRPAKNTLGFKQATVHSLDLRKFDVVVCYGTAVLRRLNQNAKLREGVLSHPKSVLILGGDMASMAFRDLTGWASRFKLICVNTPFGVPAQRRLTPGTRVEHLQWGIPRVPPDLVNPYVGTDKRVVYHGAARPRELRMLRELAELGGFQVWAGFNFIEAPGAKARGLTDAERQELLGDKVKLISGRAGPINKKYPHGPFLYGKHFPYLVHADCGLVLSLAPRMRNIRTKTLDNLGAALPMALEEGSQNNGDALNYHLGITFDYNSHAGMIQTVRRVLTSEWQRDIGRRAALAEKGWPAVAMKLRGMIPS